MFYAHGGFGGKPPTASQRRFVCDPESFAALVEASRRAAATHPGSVVGIAPHSLRAVTPDELAQVLRLAPDGPIHIHVAEQVREVEDCLAWSGRRPVEWLLDHAAADSRWCFIHATHMTAQETQRMAEAGVVAGFCPVTEANLGDGTCNGPFFLAGGGRFGIGSDSNVLVGVADELRQLEYAQRLHARQRNLMTQAEGASTGRTLYEAAAQGGAVALGTHSPLLAPGAAADVVSLDGGNAALLEKHGDWILDGWIFAARTCPVDCVWVGGRKWVEGGRHICANPSLPVTGGASPDCSLARDLNSVGALIWQVRPGSSKPAMYHYEGRAAVTSSDYSRKGAAQCNRHRLGWHRSGDRDWRQQGHLAVGGAGQPGRFSTANFQVSSSLLVGSPVSSSPSSKFIMAKGKAQHV